MRMCAAWMSVLFLLPLGCTTTESERVREYNMDGLALYSQGQYERAVQTFEAALVLQPGDPGLLHNLAQSYERLGNIPRAEEKYNACLQKDPNHAACRHGLAALLVRQGRRDEAVRMVEAWLASAADQSGPYALDGWMWHQTGDLPRAQARLQQALDRDARDLRALNELGLVYEALRRPERALVLYERSLGHRPDQPEIVQRVQALQAQGVKRPRPD